MTQEPLNIFTQKVANIQPGKRIDINIRYFNSLPWKDWDVRSRFSHGRGPALQPGGLG